MGKHRWSGWPGAFCLYCFIDDPVEQAIADNWLDPYDDVWDTEEHKQQVIEQANNCPFVPDGVDPYSLPYPLNDGGDREQR